MVPQKYRGLLFIMKNYSSIHLTVTAYIIRRTIVIEEFEAIFGTVCNNEKEPFIFSFVQLFSILCLDKIYVYLADFFCALFSFLLLKFMLCTSVLKSYLHMSIMI